MQIDGPNILELQNKSQVASELASKNEVYQKHNKKINEMYEKIDK